jgi:hypothetical protein
MKKDWETCVSAQARRTALRSMQFPHPDSKWLIAITENASANAQTSTTTPQWYNIAIRSSESVSIVCQQYSEMCGQTPRAPSPIGDRMEYQGRVNADTPPKMLPEAVCQLLVARLRRHRRAIEQ